MSTRICKQACPPPQSTKCRHTAAVALHPPQLHTHSPRAPTGVTSLHLRIPSHIAAAMRTARDDLSSHATTREKWRCPACKPLRGFPRSSQPRPPTAKHDSHGRRLEVAPKPIHCAWQSMGHSRSLFGCTGSRQPAPGPHAALAQPRHDRGRAVQRHVQLIAASSARHHIIVSVPCRSPATAAALRSSLCPPICRLLKPLRTTSLLRSRPLSHHATLKGGSGCALADVPATHPARWCWIAGARGRRWRWHTSSSLMACHSMLPSQKLARLFALFAVALTLRRGAAMVNESSWKWRLEWQLWRRWW